MPHDPAFHGQKCARCRHVIPNEPVWDGYLWYHRTCLDEALQALQRAQALAAQGGALDGAPRPSRACPPAGDAAERSNGCSAS